AVREAVPGERLRALAQRLGQLQHEPRLADPGRADQRDEAAAPIGQNALELLVQQLELAFAAHERGIEPAEEGRRVLRGLDEAIRRHALGLPLELERFDRLGLDGVADEPYVSSPIRISPGAAACSSRAAT